MNGVAANYVPAERPQEAHLEALNSAARSTWAKILPARTAPERLAHQWRDLAAHASEPNAFAEPWFTAAALRNLELASDIRMIEVWCSRADQDILIGLLPLCISRSYGRIPISFVGNWLHDHSFLGTPLVRAGREQDFWLAALVSLDQSPWARNFLHLSKLVEGGPIHRALVAAAARLGRSCDTVHKSERALLESDLRPQEYYEQTVRKKKRKEQKRLSTRLAELGQVQTRILAAGDDLTEWCDAFLALESLGWKGGVGSALGCRRETELFFREALQGALEAGRLDLLRLDLDGRPIAMLVNFLTPPGSFSFKIAFDPDFARFSPGVLIQIENLRILSLPHIRWMDSCAIEKHPMIDSLWAERRPILRVTVPLAGPARGLIFRLCRLIENGSATLRRLRRKHEQGV